MAVPNLWRTQKQRYSMQAEICPHCSNAVFPPRAVCPYCKRAANASVAPKVEGFTAVFAAQPAAMSTAGAVVAVAGDD
jgi:uncharacterized OB-fold protein